MKKILFLIHDLGQGGAEKVLVNLVNNMDKTKFDITVMSLFGGGVNEQFLSNDVRLICCHKKMMRGNSKLMTLFSPEFLWKHYVKDHYDIAVSYLEGPSARIVSGCREKNTKLVSWIHVAIGKTENLARPFRSFREAISCYNRFDMTVCVSQGVKDGFCSLTDFQRPCEVLYNTVESDKILSLAAEKTPKLTESSAVKLIAVGSLKKSKGLERLLHIMKRLRDEKYNAELYILGKGPQREELEQYTSENSLTDSVFFLGYDTNPYKYVSKCDIFVCASFAEGFSTAATEALIVGTPVCTVEVSGMKEMLGEDCEYGIVTENSEEALYAGIKRLLDDPELLAHYKEMAEIRGKKFSKEKTVKAVEDMLISLTEE